MTNFCRTDGEGKGKEKKKHTNNITPECTSELIKTKMFHLKNYDMFIVAKVIH